jgi:hypothetical protein
MLLTEWYNNQDTVREPLGTIPLEDCEVNTDNLKIQKQFMFELVSPKIEKTFYIQAANGDEMQSWVAAIKKGRSFYAVSTPFGLQHNIHVDFNSDTGFVVRYTYHVSRKLFFCVCFWSVCEWWH